MATRKKSTAAARLMLITPPAGGDVIAWVSGILDQARANVVRTVNNNMVIAYWLIGREIVLALQGARSEPNMLRSC